MKTLMAALAAILICGAAVAQVPVVGNQIDGGPSLPTKCNVGQIFFKTSATVGLNQCAVKDTWTAVGSLSCTDNGSGTLTCTAFATSGTNGGFFGVEGNGSALTPAVGSDLMWPDTVCHGFKVNLNNVAGGCVPSVDLPWTWTGAQTFSAVVTLGNGTAANPSTGFVAEPTLGPYRNGAGRYGIAGLGGVVAVFDTNSGYFIIHQAGCYQIGSTNVTAPDVYLCRRQTAGWQFGAPDAAVPVAQTIAFQGSRGGTDTNTAGADATTQGSLGTGTAAVKAVNTTAAAQGTASGTTQHTAVLRQGLNWFKSLANNTVTTVANVTDASNTSAVILIHYAIEIFDGTNVQWEHGIVGCGINNKAGVFAQNTCTKYTGFTQGLGSGTLTVTWTLTGANPALLQINSNSSLTTTTNRLTYNIENLTQQAVTEQ